MYVAFVIFLWIFVCQYHKWHVHRVCAQSQSRCPNDSNCEQIEWMNEIPVPPNTQAQTHVQIYTHTQTDTQMNDRTNERTIDMLYTRASQTEIERMSKSHQFHFHLTFDCVTIYTVTSKVYLWWKRRRMKKTWTKTNMYYIEVWVQICTLESPNIQTSIGPPVVLFVSHKNICSFSQTIRTEKKKYFLHTHITRLGVLKRVDTPNRSTRPTWRDTEKNEIKSQIKLFFCKF